MAGDALKDLLSGGGVPSVSFAPTSRYVDVGIATYTPAAASGETAVPIAFLRRRLVPSAARHSALYEVACTEGDRRDLLAAQHLGDPALWWRIADANDVFDPSAMTQLGRTLRITLATDVPGGGDG